MDFESPTNNTRCYRIDSNPFVLEPSRKPSDHPHNAMLGSSVNGSQAQGIKTGVGSGAYNTSFKMILC